MSAFFDNSITDAGRLLWAEMQAGGVFIPTKIVVGAGYLPSGKTTRTMTAVAEAIQTIALNKNEKMPGGDYIFGGVFSNKDVTEAFYYRELALYAKVERPDGTETTETLYSYGNAGANAELIPAYSTGTAVERQLDIITYIGNDATVKVEIATGIYVSKTEFDTKIGALQKAAENSVKKVDGKDLSTNDYTDADKEKVDNLPDDTNAELETISRKLSASGNALLIQTENTSVPVSAWVSNTEITGFAFRAGITIESCTAEHTPQVFFAAADAMSGNFAPVAKSYDGGVYIYAVEKPTAVLTIPTITLLKEAS